MKRRSGLHFLCFVPRSYERCRRLCEDGVRPQRIVVAEALRIRSLAISVLVKMPKYVPIRMNTALKSMSTSVYAEISEFLSNSFETRAHESDRLYPVPCEIDDYVNLKEAAYVMKR